MTIDEVFNLLKIENHKKNLGIEWQKSQEDDPGTDLPFLSEKFINNYSKQAGLNPETTEHLNCKIIPLIKSNAALARFMWHQHYLMNICLSLDKPDTGTFPSMEHLLGENEYGYNLILALAGYPAANELYTRLGIPEKVRDNTFSDLRIWCDFFKKTSNVIGIPPGMLPWTQLYLKGELFQLGRLQFIAGIFKEGIIIFKNKETDEIKAFKIDNEFDEKDSNFTGNPISPNGCIYSDKEEISLQDWNIVLKPGDTVLNIHIPASGPMTIEACADSINQAALFFPRYLPMLGNIKCFACKSWILDPQLRNILSQESNILKFQKEFYLFPVIHENPHNSAIWHIWGDVSRYASARDYPQTTNLQKTIVNFILNNGRLDCFGGIFLKDDIPFERRLYQRRPTISPT